ncbi:MAG: ABC transporter permease [Candidatus Kariarchaeaceae archaeon]
MSKKFKVKRSSKFSVKRTTAVAFRVFGQLRRDKRTFGITIGMPVLIMVIFGFAFSGEASNVPIIVENLDVGSLGGEINLGTNITQSLSNDKRVDVTIGIYEENTAKVEESKFFGIIRIPENFTQTVIAKGLGGDVKIIIDLYIDATKPATKNSILGALNTALQTAMGAQFVEFNQINAHGGAEYTGLDVSLPGVMAFVLVFLVLIISLLTIMRERLGGTQDRLYTTPLTAFERLLGYVLALLFVASIMVSSILIVGILIFGVTVKGSIFLLIIAALLFSLTHVFMAVFLSNFAENEVQAVQLAPLISFPSMALSGMMVPVYSFPSFLIPVSKVIPLTYGINLFEGIMLKGWGIKELWLDFLVITGIALLSMLFAALTVKDRMND